MCILSMKMILVDVSNIAIGICFKCSFMLKVFGHGCTGGGDWFLLLLSIDRVREILFCYHPSPKIELWRLFYGKQMIQSGSGFSLWLLLLPALLIRICFPV